MKDIENGMKHVTINQSLQTTQIKLDKLDLCDWVRKSLMERRRKKLLTKI